MIFPNLWDYFLFLRFLCRFLVLFTHFCSFRRFCTGLFPLHIFGSFARFCTFAQVFSLGTFFALFLHIFWSNKNLFCSFQNQSTAIRATTKPLLEYFSVAHGQKNFVAYLDNFVWRFRFYSVVKYYLLLFHLLDKKYFSYRAYKVGHKLKLWYCTM